MTNAMTDRCKISIAHFIYNKYFLYFIYVSNYNIDIFSFFVFFYLSKKKYLE